MNNDDVCSGSFGARFLRLCRFALGAILVLLLLGQQRLLLRLPVALACLALQTDGLSCTRLRDGQSQRFVWGHWQQLCEAKKRHKQKLATVPGTSLSHGN